MDTIDGFMMLDEKKKSILPILAQYDFLSVLSAVYAITSWRNNRGAQESCLALNAALAKNKVWGHKKIITPSDLEEFFLLLTPILKITRYDDPVLPDFGEVKINYCSRYYSVITGTGHTAPIFSALQFLEKLSELACMDTMTTKLLEYSDYCLNLLRSKNAPVHNDFSLSPQFEPPAFDYYEAVKGFIADKRWNELGVPLLSMLAAENNEIVRSHFYVYEENYYPLFNPSLVIDYQIKILLACSEVALHNTILSVLSNKLATIYNTQAIETGLTIRRCMLLNNRQPLCEKKPCFAYFENGHLVLFLDCSNDCRIDQELEAIHKAHSNRCLSIVDLEDRISSGKCKAYLLDNECKLSIICFDDYINVDETRIQMGGRDEKRIYTSIDLMYMFMFSSDVFQIVEFDSNSKNGESQVFSWGGTSDYYTVFLTENGFISKGAIEFTNVYSEIDTSAAHILTYYLSLGEVFPFHLPNSLFAAPECWNVICDDNSVYQFIRKAKTLPGGALFKYANGCSVFLSYDFLGILKGSHITQSRLSLDMFRAVTEKFFIEYQQDLSDILPLANTLVQFCCHSLSNNTSERYVCCQKVEVVSHLEQAISMVERDRLHILLLSALATEQLSVNLNRTGAILTEDIEESERLKSIAKSTQLSEKAKSQKAALLYLIETNLFLANERKEEPIDNSRLSELLSFAKWIIYLQNSSDLCFHTDSDTS